MKFLHNHPGCIYGQRRCTDIGLDPERDYCTSGNSKRALFDGETESRLVPGEMLREAGE